MREQECVRKALVGWTGPDQLGPVDGASPELGHLDQPPKKLRPSMYDSIDVLGLADAHFPDLLWELRRVVQEYQVLLAV